MGPTRVLGIDPGSHRTGWGVVEQRGSRLVHVASGTIVAGGRTADALPIRLRAIARGLADAIAAHRPAMVAVERIFHAKNPSSALMLGHARGVSLLVAAEAGLEFFEYTAGQIKQAATGRGRADKTQVQIMVTQLLGLQGDAMGLDTSDALAAAICHCHFRQSAVPMARGPGGLDPSRLRSSVISFRGADA